MKFAIVMQPLAVFEAGLRLHLPAGARALAIRGDEGARDQLDRVELRPLSLDPAPATRDIARRAVRYGGSVIFFLDERAFPVPSGFWVGGERDTRVVLAPDEPRGSVSLTLRNAPVENTVTLQRDALAPRGENSWRRGSARASGPAWARAATPGPDSPRPPAVPCAGSTRVYFTVTASVMR